MTETYETQAKGLRILPGQWRPHYPFEQIAWVSPPWPSQDYAWLDFPEAIFTDRGLIFLSHINPGIPSVYPDLPKALWETTESGLRFERTLPDGVRFGGGVSRASGRAVDLDLWIENGSAAPLRDITLQTCVSLRACREFADYTPDNKYVHVPGAGWLPYPTAHAAAPIEGGRFGLGWRTDTPGADWPIAVVLSNAGPRLLAMTWYDDTLSIVGNSGHPCVHADPRFPDVNVEERKTIRGNLIFFEGTLDQFSEEFRPGEAGWRLV